MNRNSLLYTVVFSVIIAFVFVLGLSFVNDLTKDTVIENTNKATSRAVLTALRVDFTNENVLEKFSSLEKLDDNLSVVSAELSFKEQIEAVQYYRYTKAGGETLYAIPFSGSGLWGTISGVLGIRSNLSEIIGIEIISHNETPGLGGRIDEDWYKDQYKDEQIRNFRIDLTASSSGGDSNKNNSLIDGITGATRTSESMIVIVNNAIQELQNALGGAQ